jgi:hypothetical protein
MTPIERDEMTHELELLGLADAEIAVVMGDE